MSRSKPRLPRAPLMRKTSSVHKVKTKTKFRDRKHKGKDDEVLDR